MFRNLRLAYKLILGFAVVLLVCLTVTVVAVFYMDRIADDTETMYNHPYTSIDNAQTSLVRVILMSREMKDMILAADASERQAHLDKINQFHESTLAGLNSLYQSFMGDPALIDAAIKAFRDWEPIRNEVIRYLNMGQAELAAEVTRTRGTPQVELVETAIRQVIEDARQRAANFNAQARQSASEATTTVVLLLMVAVAVAVLATYVITRSLTRPTVKLLALANEISRGNLAAEDVDYQSKDEIGQLTEAMNRMKEDLREMVRTVQSSVSNVRTSAEQLSAGAEETSASVEELAGTGNEFAGAVDRLSQSTQEMANLANKTNDLAVKGSQDIERTVQSMNEINEVVSGLANEIRGLGRYSEEIGKIVSLITGIADQTNLLALNAAIEAARAGDQGRGFAVVADEVRKLAEQSARAAGEITQLIQRIRDAVNASVEQAGLGTHKVKEGMQVVSHTGSMFAEIAEIIGTLSRGIADIAATSQQLSAGAEEMGATTEEQSALTQETAAAANVAREAEIVDEQMRRFRL